MKARFKLGQTLATPGAVLAMDNAGVVKEELLARHQMGDWLEMSEEDRTENEWSVLNGARIFSAYQYKGKKFWIITEADRSATTILLPEEY